MNTIRIFAYISLLFCANLYTWGQKSLNGDTEVYLKSLQSDLTTYLRATITSQYCMLGGKEGNAPGSHAYQYQFLCTDGYAQYAVVPHYFFAYTNDHQFLSTYYNNYSFNSGPASHFEGMKNSILPVLNTDEINHFPELKSIYKLIYYYGIIEYFM